MANQGRTAGSPTPRKPAPRDAGLLALALLAACGAPPERLVVFSGQVMGTQYNVRWVAPGADAPAPGEVERQVAAELALVDDLMTTYRDSEVTRFNAWRMDAPFAVSAPTAEVVGLALELAAATGGALDVTVGPLVSALGFGPNPPADLPNAAEVEALRSRIGYQWLAVDGESLIKHLPELELDLSAVAKGYGVDRAAAALDRLAVADYMIEVGGEVRAHGLNERGTPWRIGIERPDSADRQAERIVPLLDMALATSGDYRNYREVDGRRVSHIVDPRSGRAIDHRVASATILHPDCATADGLATAMMVLGEPGLELAEARGWAVLLLVRNGEDFVELESTAFRRLVESAQQDGS